MLLTVLAWIIVAAIAFGLRAPWSPRRVVTAAIGGLAIGLALSYFNVFIGSIRGLLTLLGFALILTGVRFLRPMRGWSGPLHRALPIAGVALTVALVAAGLFPYTEWGAKSVSEPIYQDLNVNDVTTDAPALLRAEDVRVVPWDLASRLLVRGYGEDASWLNSDEFFIQRNTYPDTVRGEFIWVHAPAPETSKWLVGGRYADRVVYVKNDASNLTPTVLPGKVNVNVDGIWWHDRVARFAQENAELRYVLQDVHLQLDDDYKPYWIAYLARLDLRGQPHLAKLVVVSAHDETDEHVYAPEDAPAWIELVYPESYVYEWARYWGQHREGFLYRWFNAARLVEPDDVTVRYIRSENQTYWLLPMKQLRSANLGGYILINTRTGASTFYDRFDDQLVDYDTAHTQLQAIMQSGEATGGQGAIRLTVSEGYIYPIKMADGTVRDAYVFPLLENLKVARFAIIDAQDYNNRRVFANSMAGALDQFSRLSGANVVIPPPTNGTLAQRLLVVEGTVDGSRTLVNLNGTWYRVAQDDLARGERVEPEREMDELRIAIARAERGDGVVVEARIADGKLVDVTLPGVTWAG